LSQVDDRIDFSQYDNNGPDNIPNSEDDDGFVDFVAIVQPLVGGECQNDNATSAIWSHRWSLSALTGSDFETNDVGKNGQKIRIDDYVIMPAKSCDAQKMIQIGVFSHEFGHAFGLPDLYDTSNQGEGVGGWDLMGSGSWGGTGNSPEAPSHMSAWSKEFLGWVHSKDIKVDTKDVRIPPVETTGETIKVDIDQDRALLLEYRLRTGFDGSLPASGLLVWSVKNSVIRPGLKNNQVNAKPDNPGLAVIEADGQNQLENAQNRGDQGDVYSGLTRHLDYDSRSRPRTFSRVALCNIRKMNGYMSVDVLISRNTCPR
jgi:M6 family metalloprotease-like protein